jgi:hypothetical protein
LKYNGKESFQSLVLIIQNSLPGNPFSLCAEHNEIILYSVALISPAGKEATNQTDVFQEGHFAQDGMKE